MRTYRTEGIILRRTNFGEADRLLTIFTKNHGKIRCRAPGIRKTISRKGAHLELFNLSSLFLAQGKSLDIVTEAQTINNFSAIRKDLSKIWIAYYFCELVESLCAERQENWEVFDLLKKSLEKLALVIARSEATWQSLANASLNAHSGEIPRYTRNDNETDSFANQLLQILGYLPRDKSLKGDDLERFIENLLERQIRTKKLLRKSGK